MENDRESFEFMSPSKYNNVKEIFNSYSQY